MTQTKSPITPIYTRKSISNYQKNKTRRLSFLAYYDSEWDLISFLENKNDLSQYLRQLLINYINKPIDINIDDRIYQKSDTRRFSFLVNKEKYPDVIKLIDALENKGAFVKYLVKLDMEK